MTDVDLERAIQRVLRGEGVEVTYPREWAAVAERYPGDHPLAENSINLAEVQRLIFEEARNPVALESDPLAVAVRNLVHGELIKGQRAGGQHFKGTATELLAKLNEQLGEQVARLNSWPASPSALSTRLRRAAPLLSSAGIQVSFKRRTGQRLIFIGTAYHYILVEGEPLPSKIAASPLALAALLRLARPVAEALDAQGEALGTVATEEELNSVEAIRDRVRRAEKALEDTGWVVDDDGRLRLKTKGRPRHHVNDVVVRLYAYLARLKRIEGVSRPVVRDAVAVLAPLYAEVEFEAARAAIREALPARRSP